MSSQSDLETTNAALKISQIIKDVKNANFLPDSKEGKALQAKIDKLNTQEINTIKSSVEKEGKSINDYIEQRKYNLILSSSVTDTKNHLGYLGGFMRNVLENHPDSNYDEGFISGIRNFPNTHAVIMFEGFYQSLYDLTKDISSFNSSLNLANPKLSFNKSDTGEYKIKAFKQEIEKSIIALKSSPTKVIQHFITQFQDQYHIFNNNLEQVNQKLLIDAISTAKELAMHNIKKGVLDVISLKNEDGKPLINDKEVRREMLAPILEKIILPNNISDICAHNTSILKEEIIGHSLQSLADKLFGDAKGATDLKKLNDPILQNQFAEAANKTIPKVLTVIDSLKNYKTILTSEDYRTIEKKYFPKIINANENELPAISNEIITSGILISRVIENALKHDDLYASPSTSKKIKKIFEKKFSSIPPLNEELLQKLAVDICNELQQNKTSLSKYRDRDHFSTKDLQKIADSLATKYNDLNVTAQKTEKSSKELKNTSRVNKIINAITGYGDLTGMVSTLKKNSTPKKEKSSPTASSTTNTKVNNNQYPNLASTKPIPTPPQETLTHLPPPLPPKLQTVPLTSNLTPPPHLSTPSLNTTQTTNISMPQELPPPSHSHTSTVNMAQATNRPRPLPKKPQSPPPTSTSLPLPENSTSKPLPILPLNSSDRDSSTKAMKKILEKSSQKYDHKHQVSNKVNISSQSKNNKTQSLRGKKSSIVLI